MTKWIVLPILLIFMSGCNDGTDESYNSSFQDGLDYIAAEDFIRAEVYFEQALESRPDDPEATHLLSQIKHYQKAIEYFDLEQYNESMEELDRVIQIENGSAGMIAKAQNLMDRAQLALDESMAQAKQETVELEEDTETEEPLADDEEADNHPQVNAEQMKPEDEADQSHGEESQSATAAEETSVDVDISSAVEDEPESAAYTFEDFQGAYVMFDSTPFESDLYFIVEIFESEIHEGWPFSEYYVTLIDSYWIEDNTLFVNGSSLDFEGNPEETDVYDYSIRENGRTELYFSSSDVTMYKVTEKELDELLTW